MNANWKKTIDRINKDRYQIPPGWDTKETIATQLECAPDRVSDLLKPGIQSGDIERQEFPVWDSARRMTVRVTCYRQKPGTPSSQPAVAGCSAPTNKTAVLMGKIAASIRANPKATDRQIAKNYRGATSALVATIRKEVAP